MRAKDHPQFILLLLTERTRFAVELNRQVADGDVPIPCHSLARKIPSLSLHPEAAFQNGPGSGSAYTGGFEPAYPFDVLGRWLARRARRGRRYRSAERLTPAAN